MVDAFREEESGFFFNAHRLAPRRNVTFLTEKIESCLVPGATE